MPFILILIVGALLLGYLWGKHDGRVEGYQHGTVALTLLLREQSLEQGSCILCNEELQKNTSLNSGYSVNELKSNTQS